MNANVGARRHEHQELSLPMIRAPMRRVETRRLEPFLQVAPNIRSKARRRSGESARQRRQGDGLPLELQVVLAVLAAYLRRIP